MPAQPASPGDIESFYAWTRLLVSLALMTLGGVGMYSVTVVLPRIQAEFGVARGDASLPYTLTMVGFGFGGILMGRLSDRFGVMTPVLIGTIGLGLGFMAAGASGSLWQFSLAQGVLIGLLGTSATFAPLVADTSRWFTRRRGIALAICMSGNYLAGAVWPPVIQHFVASSGWRQTYIGIGFFCLAIMLPLALVLRRRPPQMAIPVPTKSALPTFEGRYPERPLGLSPATLQGLLCVAGVSCCVAMAMPQVHIVAYCGDLGFGAARGAEMLSLMLGMGIVSRLASHWRAAHAATGLGAARHCAALVPALRRPGSTVCRVRPVWPVPGRHRTQLCADRARVFQAPGRRCTRRYRADGHAVRDGLGWLALGRDL